MTKKYSPSMLGFYDTDIHTFGIPEDAVDVTDAEYQSLIEAQANGKIIKPDASGHPAAFDRPPPEIDLRMIVQDHLDAGAKALGYDNIATAVTYADEPAVPKFQKEGQALRAWRSLVWSKFFEIYEFVKAGTIPRPSQSELIALLPSLIIPGDQLPPVVEPEPTPV